MKVIVRKQSYTPTKNTKPDKKKDSNSTTPPPAFTVDVGTLDALERSLRSIH